MTVTSADWRLTLASQQPPLLMTSTMMIKMTTYDGDDDDDNRNDDHDDDDHNHNDDHNDDENVHDEDYKDDDASIEKLAACYRFSTAQTAQGQNLPQKAKVVLIWSNLCQRTFSPPTNN